MSIRIDPEFRDLIPPLRPDERAQLEANIAAEGVRDPLVVWQGTLLDGHNRYEIASRMGLSYQTVEREFDSRDDALLWIVLNQFGRRNLEVPARAKLAIRIEPILAEQAKARQAAAGGDRRSAGSVRLNSDEPIRDIRAQNAARSDTQAAEAAGLKRDTYRKAKTVLTQAPAPIREAYEAGEISTHQAYQKIKKDEKARELQQAIAERANTSPAGAPTIAAANAIDWLTTIPDGSVDLLLTDPPYSTDVDDIHTFAASWLPVALRKLKPTGRAYVCVGAYPQELAAYFEVAMPEQLLVWTYRNTIGPTPSHNYKLNWQAVLYYVGAEAAPIDSPRMVEQFSVQDINAPDGRLGDRFHAWQKPLELGQRFVLQSTKPGGTVIDPFAGTGTFLLAAAEAGRIARGCERDPAMREIAVGRGCHHAD